ncbi:F-box only protein 40 [Folsomia candida]|nr:F-box only protein 40 [Folsomia candida]
MEVDIHSNHCEKCINYVQCNKMKSLRKSRGEEYVCCPIIRCRLQCGHQFHQCKTYEHELLCPKVRLPCINSTFGCPLVMERRKRGPHLATCPASVLVCTMEWNRWPLPPGKTQPFHMNTAQLDVASTVRDQKTLAAWKEFVPPTLRCLLKTYMNDRNPVMPLGVSGLRIPKSILNQAIIEHNLDNDHSESTESELATESESSDSPWGWKKCPPGLQESVCNKLKSLNVAQSVDSNQNGIQFGNMIDIGATKNGPTIESIKSSNNGCSENGVANGHYKNESHENGGSGAIRKKHVDLSLMVEVRTKCHRKPDALFTFMCCREFRRDEFPDHFSHIHSHIHTQLNGWLFTRCPMATLGCDFGLERMQPIDENYNVIYNRTSDSFCVRQKSTSQDTHNTSSSLHSSTKSQNLNLDITQEVTSKTDENMVSLSSLPFELLVHLTKYLDPLSLNSLSLTNQILRDACSCVVVDRGIVVLQWEKNPDGQLGWEVAEKKWIFSSAFSPIRTWKFGEPGRMINHMKTCPFFERNVPSKPFAYPVTMEQL